MDVHEATIMIREAVSRETPLTTVVPPASLSHLGDSDLFLCQDGPDLFWVTVTRAEPAP